MSENEIMWLIIMINSFINIVTVISIYLDSKLGSDKK